MTMLVFDYKVDASTGSDFEIFFSPFVGGHSINKGGQPATEEWVTAYFDISGARKDWGWGYAGNNLRFDPATGSGAQHACYHAERILTRGLRERGRYGTD